MLEKLLSNKETEIRIYFVLDLQLLVIKIFYLMLIYFLKTLSSSFLEVATQTKVQNSTNLCTFFLKGTPLYTVYIDSYQQLQMQGDWKQTYQTGVLILNMHMRE